MNRSVQKLSFLLCLTVLVFGPTVEGQTAENSASVEVLLVRASNNKGGVDPALKSHAGTLQRLFRFNSYALEGRRIIRFTVPGEGSANLARRQSLSIRAEAVDGPTMKAEIEWKRGSQRLLHTRINLRSGNPAVLGGPRSEDGTWLLILQRR